jgi:PAS domain S-box-containing protein
VNFPRATVAARVGLHGACALPIRQGPDTVGVIELLSLRVRPLDPHLLQMLMAVGIQIGQFLDRRWAEEALLTERNLLRTLIDTLPDYVYAKDTEGRYVLNNLAHVRVMGAAQPREVRAKTDLDFFPKELALRYRADEALVLQSGQPLFNREEPVVDSKGNRQCVLTNKVPWKDGQGRIVGLIGVSRDITERKLAEEQLRRANTELGQNQATLQRTLQELKAAHEELKSTELQLIQAAKLECLGTLAAGVAHEVKNPLQTILMGLHYLAHNLPANQEGIALTLQDMRDAVLRAKVILRGLLELSADTKSETKPEDLNACVERSLALLHYDTAAAKKEEVSSRGGRIGGFPFLAKPADMPEVIACLEQHLGKPNQPKLA